MTEQNDHDLLVRLDAKVEMLITSQNSFIQASTSQTKELGERIARLEIKDRGDSEKVATITSDVQRSLNNAARIDTLTSDVNELKDWKTKIDARGWQIAMVVIGLIISNIWQWFVK